MNRERRELGSLVYEGQVEQMHWLARESRPLAERLTLTYKRSPGK